MKINKTFVSIVSLFTMLMVLIHTPLLAQDVPAHAITNVIVHMADGSVVENSNIVWRNGIIEQVGVNESIPFDAFVIDGGDSLHVYPGLIDGLATWGSPDIPRDLPRLENPGKPTYDRAGAQPNRIPAHYLNEDKSIEAAMKAGFTLVSLGLDGQMLPGHIQPFNLSAAKLTQAHAFSDPLALQGSFDTAPGSWGSGAYPSTQMGVMAYFRQLMYDASALQEHMMYFENHSDMSQPEQNDVLEALFPLVNREYPLFFEVDSKEEIERMFRLQDEFGFEVVLVSAKEASALSEELKARNIAVLASLDVREMPDWLEKEIKETEAKDQEKSISSDDQADNQDVKKMELTEEELVFRLKQKQAWQEEINNLATLVKSGIPTGFTSDGLSPNEIQKKINLVTEYTSLSKSDLIELMTIQNANILGISNRVGAIKEGNSAHLILTDGPLFEKGTKIHVQVSQGVINDFMED
ncbi:MAG: hypothetical protein CL672_04415 [Balneola sp.]|nr:hypothetical protein [Balneola sp.]